MEIAAFIKANGAAPKKDLIELWKRIVFNMAVSNTDDHLRNHAFVLTEGGWILSPLYDVNPVPYGNELALNVNDVDNTINIELALEVAERFGIKLDDAKKYAEDILNIVKNNWLDTAKKYGITHGQIEDMRPAFGIC
ncbi:MAG TPA: HipA domain-containing protein [Candidatus Alectryocaccobium stercorigallinarum]|nr:HipA domain-containing protein [Candidatus Alectryocaccobium stercorigallinarum]